MQVSNTLFSDSLTPSSFQYWVKLKLHDLTNQWFAHTVHTIVAPSLCADVILELLFLSLNSLIVDTSSCTCIDKTTGFDILNSPPPVTVSAPINSTSLDSIFANCHELKKELSSFCATQHLKINKSCELLSTAPVVAAIWNRIETLAYLQKLKDLNDTVKTDYADIFMSIPHVDKMPKEVTCSIKLKNTNKTIVTHLYTSPKNFKDA